MYDDLYLLQLLSSGGAPARPLGVVSEIRADCVQSARIFFCFLRLTFRLFLHFSVSTRPGKVSSTGCCRATQPAKGFFLKPNLIWRRKLPNLPSSQVPFTYFLFLFRRRLDSYSFVVLATTAALLEANTLKARVSELENQLGTTTQELERLRSVETDLSNSSERLRGELMSLRAAHKEELEKVVAAQASTEDALRKERNAAVATLRPP